MLLAIDIGNTNITVGIFKFRGKKSVKKPEYIWNISTDKLRTADEYGSKILGFLNFSDLEAKQVKAIAIASVVPVLDKRFEKLSKKYFDKKPFFVSYNNKLPFKIKYNNPSEIGADRIANSAAVYSFHKAPAIVIDFGTATTFDCINKQSEYIGGIIAPGPLIASEALAKRTSKLPLVEVAPTKTVIGKSTVKCIQSGLYFGYIGLIKELIRRVIREMNCKPKIIATGGLADVIEDAVNEIDEIIPELTLEGIRIIWQENIKNC